MSQSPTPVPLEASHLEALREFFRRLPEGDVTFIKEDILDERVVAGLVDSAQTDASRRWVVTDDDGGIIAYAALLRQQGWSSHVGEQRLVVDAEHRGEGLGRALARHTLVAALEMGLRKIFVEVVADAEPTVTMFQRIGYDAEALLADHICDRSGELRDLMVLSHHTQGTWSSLATAGIDEEVGA